jgi:hypothetical protein
MPAGNAARTNARPPRTIKLVSAPARSADPVSSKTIVKKTASIAVHITRWLKKRITIDMTLPG